MQRLFETWRKYSLLSEEQLIIEGRISDTKKKYPELAKQRKELDGESLLDVLMGADPSNNQKYLMGAAKILQNSMEAAESEPDDPRSDRRSLVPFWGKEWPEDPDDNLYSPWGIAKNIADELPKFHKLQPFIQAERRDINTIKDWNALSNVVHAATIKQQTKEREKEEKKREKTRATEESTIVEDNDSYTMIRPESTEASCYYGKGTQWCISATQASNYFDEYTSDGKTFYFVFFAHLSQDNPYKKIALVMHHGDYEEAFDAEDNSLYPAQVVDAIIQNMLNEKQDTGALEVYRFMDGERHTDEPLEKDREDYVRMVKELGIAWDDVLATSAHLFREEAERANEAIRNKAELWFRDMKQAAAQDTEENPAGPSEEQYNEVLAKYEPGLNNISISLEMPWDTGASQAYWNAYLYVDAEEIVENNKQRLKWKKNIEQREELDELREAVDSALNAVDIWPDDLEQDNNDPFRFNVSFESEGGSPDDFESYMDNIQYLDEKFTEEFAEALHSELVEKDLIGRDPKEEEYWPDPEEKKKQIELPFEKGSEEGAQAERDLDYIRSPAAAALRRRVGLRENKIRIKILKK